MARLMWILGVLVLVVGCIWLYNRHNALSDQLGSGIVISHDTSSDSNSKDASDADNAKQAATPIVPTTPAPANPAPPANLTSATQPTVQAKPSAALPVSDTIERNPPNGTVFAATGKYTWYRQGNITWRVNSATGASCIDYATMEEWRKPLVYSHGCRNA